MPFVGHASTSLSGTGVALPVARAIAAIARGALVIVTDDDERENEDDRTASAQRMRKRQVAFNMVDPTTKVLRAAMDGERADRPPLLPIDHHGEPADHGIDNTCEAADCGSGVSAKGRCRPFFPWRLSCPMPITCAVPGPSFPWLRGLVACRGAVDMSAVRGLLTISVSQLIDWRRRYDYDELAREA